MNTFYVNVVVHGGLHIEAETEDEAVSEAQNLSAYELEDVYHVDTGTVDHADYCNCDLCLEGGDE